MLFLDLCSSYNSNRRFVVFIENFERFFLEGHYFLLIMLLETESSPQLG